MVFKAEKNLRLIKFITVWSSFPKDYLIINFQNNCVHHLLLIKFLEGY
jgi:hypothetical protein